MDTESKYSVRELSALSISFSFTYCNQGSFQIKKKEHFSARESPHLHERKKKTINRELETTR